MFTNLMKQTVSRRIGESKVWGQDLKEQRTCGATAAQSVKSVLADEKGRQIMNGAAGGLTYSLTQNAMTHRNQSAAGRHKIWGSWVEHSSSGMVVHGELAGISVICSKP